MIAYSNSYVKFLSIFPSVLISEPIAPQNTTPTGNNDKAQVNGTGREHVEIDLTATNETGIPK